MTERGLPLADGAPACPFVAFDDDRDARSQTPDHRHRCYAEAKPAPRAIAHQEAYCLSSAFPVCPTFQDWARREAAQTHGGQGTVPSGMAGGGGSAPAAGAAVAAAAASGGDGRDPDSGQRAGEEPALTGRAPALPPAELPARRNPPRDWAAPPPWAGNPGASPGRGLAGSTADRIATGDTVDASAWAAPPPPARPPESPAASSPADDEVASLLRPPAAAAAGAAAADTPGPTPSGGPPAAGGPNEARDSRRDTGAPDWEQPRRYEAYPTIKARRELPSPRLAVMAAALAIAALALFLVGSFLGGRGGAPVAVPAGSVASPAPAASAAPSISAAPSAQLYTIRPNDTLSKVANRFHVTLDELLAANKDQIKDPNKIAIGDQIIIPVPGSAGESASPAVGASGSSAP
ncbi:MAG: LysM peptidoglycan-binding domain-containing protein [Chloroflexota bacterium]